MKKTYIKPEFNEVCFDLSEDIVVASTDPHGVLDTVSDGFEKITDGILDFFNDLGNGI